MVTDVTEFKLLNGQKSYLSAIFDLADKSIVSYVVGHSNNNQLVLKTWIIARDNLKPNCEILFINKYGDGLSIYSIEDIYEKYRQLAEIRGQ